MPRGSHLCTCRQRSMGKWRGIFYCAFTTPESISLFLKLLDRNTHVWQWMVTKLHVSSQGPRQNTQLKIQQIPFHSLLMIHCSYFYPCSMIQPLCRWNRQSWSSIRYAHNFFHFHHFLLAFLPYFPSVFSFLHVELSFILVLEFFSV